MERCLHTSEKTEKDFGGLSLFRLLSLFLIRMLLISWCFFFLHVSSQPQTKGFPTLLWSTENEINLCKDTGNIKKDIITQRKIILLPSSTNTV